ncbi:MAG: GNAT family N-acetyltransferase [Acidimicrobiia bacterium]
MSEQTSPPQSPSASPGPGPAVEIVELAHHLELGPLLAGWHAAEWAHLYEPHVWNRTIAEAEFAAMTMPGTIPTTWVAFEGAGRTEEHVLGSVSLIASDDLDGFEHLTPWLASLYIAPARRSLGVGGKLVAHLLDAAATMGIDRVHLFTAGQEAYYLARGWRTLARTEAHGHPAAVMVRSTDRHAARRSVSSSFIGDPDIAGAYAYLRRGATPADRDALNGEAHPGLHLAGEAGSRAYPGTLHGAWFSGEQRADAVLAARRRGRLDPHRPVIVVGAGVAGLAAARRLRDHRAAGGGDGGDDVAVIVVEAKAHIGGRAATDRTLGGPVHLGGAWLHGHRGHPLHGLGVSGIPTEWDEAAVFVVGHGPVDPGPARQVQARLLERVAAAADAARAQPAATPDPSYGSVALHELAAVVAELDVGPVEQRIVRTWLRGEIESLYAAPLHDLSLRHGSEAYELDGDDLLITTPLDAVLEQLADGLDVRLGQRVVSIEAVAGGALWRVRTEAGDELLAAAVIVTVPLGVLRQGRPRVDPPWPPTVAHALAQLDSGPVAKVFFSFDEAFWAPHPLFWLADDPPPTFGLWVDVSALTGSPTLCAFAVGDDARWAETASDDERCRRADELLRAGRVRS